MKKTLILLTLVISLVVCGCGKKSNADKVDFSTMSDEELMDYSKKYIIENVSKESDGKYVVSNIQIYAVSNEYLQEVKYNSLETVYFGYKLSDLEKEYSGKKYIFSVNEDGKTVSEEYSEYISALNQKNSIASSFGSDIFEIDLIGDIVTNDGIKKNVIVSLAAPLLSKNKYGTLLLASLPSILDCVFDINSGNKTTDEVADELSSFVEDYAFSMALSSINNAIK